MSQVEPKFQLWDIAVFADAPTCLPNPQAYRPGFELGSKFQIFTSAACSNQEAVGMYARYQLRGRMYCIVWPVRRYTNRLQVPYDTPYVGVMARRVSLAPNFTLRPWASGRGFPPAGLLPAAGESLPTLLESASQRSAPW